MEYVLISLGAYLLGCSNMALCLSKLKHVDPRMGGSENLGASNAMILMGWKAGILVGAHGIGKSVLAVILAQALFPQLEYAGVAAGAASVLGHIFPFYLNFKGGKGFASYLGMTLALNWKLALVVLALVAAVTLITDYLAAGTFTTIAVVPLWTGIVQHSWILAGSCVLALRWSSISTRKTSPVCATVPRSACEVPTVGNIGWGMKAAQQPTPGNRACAHVLAFFVKSG